VKSAAGGDLRPMMWRKLEIHVSDIQMEWSAQEDAIVCSLDDEIMK
jgi:hypothetical protein